MASHEAFTACLGKSRQIEAPALGRQLFLMALPDGDVPGDFRRKYCRNARLALE
jgi:hypothetical protein